MLPRYVLFFDLSQLRFAKESLHVFFQILNWVKGPGQKLLISQTRLPFSFEEADEIRKAHEQFEFKCMVRELHFEVGGLILKTRSDRL